KAEVPGGDVIFVVDIQKPKDLQTLASDERAPFWARSARSHVPWPRMMRLETSPAWKCACFPELRPGGGAAEPVLTFIGRCKADDSLEMTLGYPRAHNKWKDVPIRLDLHGAGRMSRDMDAIRWWATTQANWFRALGEQAGDFGGFFAFA